MTRSNPTVQTVPERTYAQGIVSFLGAAGLMLIVPFVIVAVGLPLALGVRALIEVAGWLVSLVR